MTDVLTTIGDGLWNAFLMAWEVWWALVLGFAISAVVQAWAQHAITAAPNAPAAVKDNLSKFLTGLVSAVAHITAPTQTLNAQREALRAAGRWGGGGDWRGATTAAPA